jgi:hypothetical protein
MQYSDNILTDVFYLIMNDYITTNRWHDLLHRINPRHSASFTSYPVPYDVLSALGVDKELLLGSPSVWISHGDSKRMVNSLCCYVINWDKISTLMGQTITANDFIASLCCRNVISEMPDMGN